MVIPFQCLDIGHKTVLANRSFTFLAFLTWLNIKIINCSNLATAIQHLEAYLEPSCTSTMELFCENSSRLLAVIYFHKKDSS